MSVADSVDDFSGIQGRLGWQYGYAVDPTAAGYALDSFQDMTNFDPAHPDTYGASVSGLWTVSPNFTTVWTAITPSGGHGNGTITSGGRDPIEQWAIRRWVSDVKGTVDVNGQVADSYLGGNGSHARIFVDGVAVWDTRILDGSSPTDFSVSIPVSIGSIVDFALDPEASDDRSDTAMFTAAVHASIAVGDTNFDGSVNFVDLLTLAKNYGRTDGSARWFDGDFDDNGHVDFSDLLGLARNYGQTANGYVPNGTAADAFAADWNLARSMTPEPTASVVAITFATWSSQRRRPPHSNPSA